MRKLEMHELNRKDAEATLNALKMPVVIILDNVRSALNVGSVFRTSDAFAVEEIILCGITAQPPHKEILKTALGATQSVQWKYFPETVLAIEDLQSKGYRVIAIEQVEGSTLLTDFKMTENEKIALVLGNEVYGVSIQALEKINEAIEIPQSGSKHSINIAVCAGVICWEFYRQYSEFVHTIK